MVALAILAILLFAEIIISKSLQRQSLKKWIAVDLTILATLLGLLCSSCYGNYSAPVYWLLFFIVTPAVYAILLFIAKLAVHISLRINFNRSWFTKFYAKRFTRFGALSQTIRELWDIKASLDQLPDFPIWSINSTSSETGHRFRFKEIEMGDYETEYAKAPQFSLAEAITSSAAVPGLVGPMPVRTNDYIWEKPEEKPEADQFSSTSTSFSYLHLYDGGVYDNFGMEPMFDVGEHDLKEDKDPRHLKIDYLIVSDGGAKLQGKSAFFALDPRRLIRIVDIISDQVRALRVRSFVNFLQNPNKKKEKPNSGAYIGIGKNCLSVISKCEKNNKPINKTTAEEFKKKNWLPKQKVDSAKNYDTDLKKMTGDDFDNLVQHGYETAKWSIELFILSAEDA